jgi:uncharacterized protein YcnI
MNRITRTATVLGAATAAALALWAAPASAHVTVNPKEATQGGFAKLTFRVPNEKDAGDTTKVEVALPMDTPLGSVSYKPTAGWTTVVSKSKLDKPIKTDDGTVTEAISRVTWTADSGSGIKPGQFQEFDLSVGPLPTTKAMKFKALQTYSDGEIVRWIDEAEDGAHPAPTLTLTKAATATGASTTTAANTDYAKPDNGPAVGMGIAGLVAGLAGLILGGLAFARARRAPAPAAAPATTGQKRETIKN